MGHQSLLVSHSTPSPLVVANKDTYEVVRAATCGITKDLRPLSGKTKDLAAPVPDSKRRIKILKAQRPPAGAWSFPQLGNPMGYPLPLSRILKDLEAWDKGRPGKQRS